MAEALEQNPNAVGKEAEKKPEPPTVLEQAGTEFKEAGKAFINSAVGLGALGASYFMPGIGGLENLILASSQPVAARITSEKMPSKDFRDESLWGLVQGAGVYASLGATQSIAKAYGANNIANILGYSVSAAPFVAAGVALAAAPILTTIYYPIRHLIVKKSFKGLGESLKKYYVKTQKDVFLTYGLATAAGAAMAMAMPAYAAYWLIGSGFLGNIGYRLKVSEKWHLSKMFTPIAYPFKFAYNLGSVAYKSVNRIGEALYGFGSAVSNWFKTAAKPAAPATPEPKPA